MKTSELTGAALDWVVAKCEGIPVDAPDWNNRFMDAYGFSSDWSQGGPIIEREKIQIGFTAPEELWRAEHWVKFAAAYGPTPLIAAMRCYCRAKLGDEVGIPEELT